MDNYWTPNNVVQIKALAVSYKKKILEDSNNDNPVRCYQNNFMVFFFLDKRKHGFVIALFHYAQFCDRCCFSRTGICALCATRASYGQAQEQAQDGSTV